MQNINRVNYEGHDPEVKRILVLGGGQYLRPFVEHGDVDAFDTTKCGGIDVSEYNLVVFTGGHDVSPNLYGEKMHTRTSSLPFRDASEEHIFKQCKEYGIPMVGICRGSQFLTVMNGGKLVQHVENHAVGGTHPIITDAGVELQVTSTHHQMMQPRGKYKLLAYAEGMSDVYQGEGDKQIDVQGSFDTTDEGKIKEPDVVWYPNTRSLAVQYHPEYMGEDTEGYKYFQNLLEEYVL